MPLVHEDLTRTILACAYRVHSRLGPGLLERAYKECLCYELNRLEIPFETEKLLPVTYDGVTIQLGYRLDLLVADLVIVEIKAVEDILPVHEAQLLSYLKLSGKRVGLLINFNVARLRDGIRRRVNETRSSPRPQFSFPAAPRSPRSRSYCHAASPE